MAVAPSNNVHFSMERKPQLLENGHADGRLEDVIDGDFAESDDDSDISEINEQSFTEDACIALACDDGFVRLYMVSDSDDFTYHKSLPSVVGRILSVAWNPKGDAIYSGSSDGSGTLVSADSNGSVQFWDSRHGTLLQARSMHKGGAYALAAAHSHNRVSSAGSDGQVILYKISREDESAAGQISHKDMKSWVYVGYVRVHTHDICSLAVAVPISCEGVHEVFTT